MSVIQADFNLHERIAIVTGALGTLGSIFCQILLRADARVAAIDLPGTAYSAPFQALRDAFADRLQLFHADVTNRPSLEAAHTRMRELMGPPAVLVNNAGIDQPPGALKATYTIEDIPAELGRRILDVNVIGLFQCTQVFLPSLRQSGHGSIINIGSLYASVSPDARLYDHLNCSPPFLKPAMYGASKAAVVNLTKYLATHLAGTGVRVNTFSPGGVLGGQDPTFRQRFVERVPLGRMANPVDLAGPLVFLASEASSYVTGINLRVDGGFTLW